MKFLKKSGFNYSRVVPLLIFICIGLHSFAQAQSGEIFDSLKERFNGNQVFTAAFEHEYRDTFTGETQRTEGTIWIGKDRYKIISGENIMVVDGEISRVYDSSKNRVIISEYVEEDDDFAPSRMLQGVDDTYTTSEESTQGGGAIIRLVSEDPFSIFSAVEIFLNRDEQPEKIEAVDQVENELVTIFYEGQFIDATNTIFRFPRPEGAEEIDLRHGSP